MTELSPQAQAVLDAAFSAYWSAEQEAPNDEGMIAAAALRAAADQARQAAATVTPSTEWDEGWRTGAMDVAGGFLAIATELEGFGQQPALSEIELLTRIKKYIEETEELIDGERGECRNAKCLIAIGKMPAIYSEVLQRILAIATEQEANRG